MMRLLRRLLYLLQRDRREQEIAEEIELHRALAEREHRADGLAPDMARYAATRQMGNATLAREDAHHVWFPAAMEGVLKDFGYAWRGLRRSWGLLAVACLSLGLSTGFGTALFSVVNAVIMQPITAARPDDLVRFWIGTGNRLSWLNLQDVCEGTPGLTCVGHRIEEVSWQPGDEPVRLFGQAVSPDYFKRLGIGVALGHTFTSESIGEERDAAVITHAFWQRQIAGDPNVLGRKLVLSGHTYTVIGVLPRGFRSVWGLGIAPSVYLPAGSALRPATAKRADAEYELLGVLGPGQSMEQFQSVALARAKYLEHTYPENREFSRVQAWPVHRFGLFLKADEQMTKVLLLFGSVLIILVLLLAVVACINVAGLLVARALARQREIAVRLSIGCGRMRLARLLLAESFLLAVLGVGLGALVSIWLAKLLVTVPLPFPIPFELEVPIDTHLLAYLAVLVGLATCVTGLAPILQTWRTRMNIGAANTMQATGTRRWSLRRYLIVGQVAVSTVMLVATMLFVRSLWAASQVSPGFDLDRVATIELDTRTGQLAEQQVVAYQQTVLARLRERPGISGVSAANVIPLSMASIVNSVQVDAGGKEQNVRAVNSNWILPKYFKVMGIAMRAGRDFRESDRQSKARAAIVNETFARTLFPNSSPLGHRVRRPSSDDNPNPWAEIVGVVADSRYLTLGETPRPLVYWPFSPEASGMTIHVRTEGDAGILVRELPDALRSVDSRVGVRVRPLRSVMAVALFPSQVAATLLSALGLVGWGLTIAGLYGVVAYSVARRVPEIGVRMALGARSGGILMLLLREGLSITAVGLVLGLIIAAAGTPLLGMFLAGVNPHDPQSFALVAIVLVFTAFLASYGPARGGTRLTPADALRSD